MKKYLKKRSIVFGVLLIVLIVITLWACFKADENNTAETALRAEEISEDKPNEAVPLEAGEKTVYAKADPKGNVKEISVETLMKDEEGEEFRYKEEFEDELPLAVKISYYLEGKQIEPEELAGKSGKVKIRFDYENLTGKKENTEDSVMTPFTAITALVLPTDIFSNIEVKNAELISMEGQNMVVGYALPGVTDYLQLKMYEPTEELDIPDYVEITADAAEFELDFTATVITNGTFKDLKEEDLSDAEEMTDSMEELSDASQELVEGTSELYDGMKEFHSYIIDFAEAIGTVSDGTGVLKDGLKTLNDNKGELKSGLEALNTGLELLDQSLTAALQPKEDDSTLSDNRVEQPTESELALMQTIQTFNISEEQQAQLMANIQMVVTEKVTGTVSSVQESVSSLHEGSEALAEGMDAFSEGIGQLYDGSVELHEGTEELFDASIDLNDGLVEVVDGVEELKDGFEEFDREGIEELEKLAGTELKTIVSRLRKLKEADENWKGFSESEENSSSVRIILETEEI